MDSRVANRNDNLTEGLTDAWRWWNPWQYPYWQIFHRRIMDQDYPLSFTYPFGLRRAIHAWLLSCTHSLYLSFVFWVRRNNKNESSRYQNETFLPLLKKSFTFISVLSSHFITRTFLRISSHITQNLGRIDKGNWTKDDFQSNTRAACCWLHTGWWLVAAMNCWALTALLAMLHESLPLDPLLAVWLSLKSVTKVWLLL